MRLQKGCNANSPGAGKCCAAERRALKRSARGKKSTAEKYPRSQGGPNYLRESFLDLNHYDPSVPLSWEVYKIRFGWFER